MEDRLSAVAAVIVSNMDGVGGSYRTVRPASGEVSSAYAKRRR